MTNHWGKVFLYNTVFPQKPLWLWMASIPLIGQVHFTMRNETRLSCYINVIFNLYFFLKGRINRFQCRSLFGESLSVCEATFHHAPQPKFISTLFMAVCSRTKPQCCSTTGELQGHGWTSYETPGPSLSIYQVHSTIWAGLRRVIFQWANTSTTHNTTTQQHRPATRPARHNCSVCGGARDR